MCGIEPKTNSLNFTEYSTILVIQKLILYWHTGKILQRICTFDFRFLYWHRLVTFIKFISVLQAMCEIVHFRYLHVNSENLGNCTFGWHSFISDVVAWYDFIKKKKLFKKKITLTTVQICRLENIELKSMKQVSYSGEYSFSACRAHQSHLQFSFVVCDVFCPRFLHV